MGRTPLSPRRRTVGPRSAVLAVALALFVALLAPTPAGATGGDAANYVARINSLRASVGVGSLQVDGALTAGAQAWADQMAASGTLAHAPNLASGLSGHWSKLGENVGVGPDNATIWPAFVASAHHYANIVDPAFNYVGVGVAYAGGRQYTCHRFMQLGGGSSAPSPIPAPTPKPATTPRPASSKPATPITAPPVTAPAPAPPAAPVSPTGPPPPADTTRVATVLSALRQLNT